MVRDAFGANSLTNLGGAKAFKRVAKDDESATSPGDVLRELFIEPGPPSS